MKLKGKDLEFISWIKRDGSGTGKIGDELISFMQEQDFEVNSLSMSFDTFIATDGMNWFVVKLKNGITAILTEYRNRMRITLDKKSQNNYTKCKRTWFSHKGNKYYMRSSWEIRYAALLSFYEQQKIIKNWEYEPDTFWFDGIKRGVRSYKPDFKIFKNDGTIEYHEVKGRMDAKSRTKLNRMRIYHPEIEVVLIDAGYFKLNKNLIPSYKYALETFCIIQEDL